MQFRIIASGQLKSGPERDLIDQYSERIRAGGASLALGPLTETQIDARNFRDKASESAALASKVPDGAALCLLDERGKALTSREFAFTLARWRDDGIRDAAFVIGGADGLDRTAFRSPDLVLSFGKLVWPHMLVRAMLAEQLYRAVSILSGAPYHRD
ncbi:23S rRNA (pseudouridine(1915)-N(3))-methyltransferase RlmH [Hyphobacterium sp.]|uniref:23S rRNA (pseudouridine(1915)-N(3))-methyltransferase RlmH n=1 Tax=Hyphobacterium sp. TaxID=2004662 RepID=UPI003BA8E48B